MVRHKQMANYQIVTGNSNRELAQAVCRCLGALDGNPSEDSKWGAHESEPQLSGQVGRFADGEINLSIPTNVRGQEVYIVHPTCPPVNDSIMELVLLTQALKLASAEKITLVIPYFGYARQDRKTAARTPISAAAVAQVLSAFQPSRIVTLDLHCGQIQGFFHNIPVDNLYAQGIIADHLKGLFRDKTSLCVVSPDAGGVPRARQLAHLLSTTDLVTIVKHRAAANQIESVKIIGDVHGKVCIVIDDIIDTAGTVCAGAAALKSAGASTIVIAATHGLFSGPAHDRLHASCIDRVIVTDSVPQRPFPHATPVMDVLSVAPLLAQAIHRLHTKQSLSVLFQ